MYLENLTGGSESVISRILSDTLFSTLECFEACGDGDNGDNWGVDNRLADEAVDTLLWVSISSVPCLRLGLDLNKQKQAKDCYYATTTIWEYVDVDVGVGVGVGVGVPVPAPVPVPVPVVAVAVAAAAAAADNSPQILKQR
ncbi:hypothetical protein BOTCAL_0128g00130 [Botryotinia calthae]|uniref:Uncharacterized protein n=1 Tax=Botryotinia calthae TaxID=38488 RepID=A0A4Y8D3Y8_9HELO|nr:hypothetical protein BOTCAL_0128g00130 [Botryotinia calthae]